jgi:hypothetical protein
MRPTTLIVAGLALTLLPAPRVRAGAPAPSLSVDVWTPLPLNAPIRVTFRAIMIKIPDGLAGKLTVHRKGKRVGGTWVVDNRGWMACGSIQRLAFRPHRPLTAGTYELRGFPTGHRGLMARRQRVVILDRADTTPPRFAGLEGVYCQRPNALLGCRPYGIGLRPGKASDPQGSRLRFVAHIRRRGQPYQPEGRTEAAHLPWTANAMVKGGKPGRYVLTLRALDLAGNASDRICEAPLKLPLTSCRGFPGSGPGGKVSVVHGAPSGLIRARCARRRNRGLVSAIDGVRIRFDAPAPGSP